MLEFLIFTFVYTLIVYFLWFRMLKVIALKKKLMDKATRNMSLYPLIIKLPPTHKIVFSFKKITLERYLTATEIEMLNKV